MTFLIYHEIVLGSVIHKKYFLYSNTKKIFLNQKCSQSEIINKKIVNHLKNHSIPINKEDHEIYYIVKPKDTIYSISKLYCCHYNILLRENNIHKPYKIVEGQKIFIPNYIKKTKKKINKPSLKLSNAWSWPLEGKILHTFSNTEFGNKGIDILSLKPNVILAASSGEVVYVGDYFKSYGKMILLKHNNNYLSIYAHVDSILVQIKQKVNMHQKIATIKPSINNSKLFYFEMRYQGEPVNPLKYLLKKSIN